MPRRWLGLALAANLLLIAAALLAWRVVHALRGEVRRTTIERVPAGDAPS